MCYEFEGCTYSSRSFTVSLPIFHHLSAHCSPGSLCWSVAAVVSGDDTILLTPGRMSQRQVKERDKEKDKEAGLQTPNREHIATPSGLSPGVSYSHGKTQSHSLWSDCRFKLVSYLCSFRFSHSLNSVQAQLPQKCSILQHALTPHSKSFRAIVLIYRWFCLEKCTEMWLRPLFTSTSWTRALFEIVCHEISKYVWLHLCENAPCLLSWSHLPCWFAFIHCSQKLHLMSR